MIELSCTCGKKIKVPDTMAGKKGKCPGCGSTLDIVAPPPPPAKKDDLLLELDDAPRKQVPMEAILPPTQDLPGAPPAGGKKKPAAPRLANSDLIDDIPKESRSKAPSAAGADGKIECPVCHEKYEADVLFCMKCKVDIATGKPIAGLTGTGAKTRGEEQIDTETFPVPQLLLGMLYKPAKLLPYFQGFLERKDMKIGMLGFYAASFIIVAISANAASGKRGSLEVKGPTREDKIAQMEKEAGTYEPHYFENWTGQGQKGLESPLNKQYVFRVTEPKGPVQPGEPFTVRFSFCEPGPGKGIDGEAWVQKTDSWKGPITPFEDAEQGKQAGQPGDFSVGLDAEAAAGSSFVIRLFPKGTNPEDGTAKELAVAHVAWASKPGWAAQVMDDLTEDEGKKKGSIEQEAAKLEKKKGKLIAPREWTRAFDTSTGRVGAIDAFYWKLENPPTDVESGTEFPVSLKLAIEKDGQPGDPLDVEVYVLNYGQWDDDDEAPDAKVPKATPVGSGTYNANVKAVIDRETYVSFEFCAKGQALTYQNMLGKVNTIFPSRPGWARKVVEKERKEWEKEHEKDRPTTAAGKVKKALVGSKAIFGQIFANFVCVLLSSLLLFGAVKFFGGGASFQIMIFTVAFLVGYANLLSLGSFFFAPKDQDFAQYLQWAVMWILLLLALVKVFDLPLGGALIAAAIGTFPAALFGVWVLPTMFGTSMTVSAG